MSADLLREAAAKMRERAEAAQATEVWRNDESDRTTPADGPFTHHVSTFANPAVALAVADWLEVQAASWERVYVDTQRPSAGVDQPPARHFWNPAGASDTADFHARYALAVATAYLAT